MVITCIQLQKEICFFTSFSIMHHLHLSANSKGNKNQRIGWSKQVCCEITLSHSL